MASDLRTQQTPKTGSSTKVVLAERVYMAPSDVILAYTAPTAKLGNAAPGGTWVDLGIVAGSKVDLTYTKEIAYIETGLEKVRRGSYLKGKTAQAVFTLEQYDMALFESLSGLTRTQVQNNAGNAVIGGLIHIGQDSIVNRSLLFIGTGVIDGKEYHHYSAKGGLSFTFEMQEDSRVIKCTADLYSFVPTNESIGAYLSLYILD